MNFGVYLYDSTCQPLGLSDAGAASRIIIELFDLSNNHRLASKVSGKFQPKVNEWGAILTWTGASSPLEILFRDPNLTYSGQSIDDLNGLMSGRIDQVLRGLPSSGGGLGSPSGQSAADINAWVSQHSNWTATEKVASRRLINNYIRLILPSQESGLPLHSLSLVAENWERAMKRIGFDTQWLKSSSTTRGTTGGGRYRTMG